MPNTSGGNISDSAFSGSGGGITIAPNGSDSSVTIAPNVSGSGTSGSGTSGSGITIVPNPNDSATSGSGGSTSGSGMLIIGGGSGGATSGGGITIAPNGSDSSVTIAPNVSGSGTSGSGTSGSGITIVPNPNDSATALSPEELEAKKQKIEELQTRLEGKRVQLDLKRIELENNKDSAMQNTLKGEIAALEAEIGEIKLELTKLSALDVPEGGNGFLQEDLDATLNKEIIENLADLPEFVAKVHQTLLLTQDSYNAILLLLGRIKHVVDGVELSYEEVLKIQEVVTAAQDLILQKEADLKLEIEDFKNQSLQSLNEGFVKLLENLELQKDALYANYKDDMVEQTKEGLEELVEKHLQKVGDFPEFEKKINTRLLEVSAGVAQNTQAQNALIFKLIQQIKEIKNGNN